jgi:hypothetical protein
MNQIDEFNEILDDPNYNQNQIQQEAEEAEHAHNMNLGEPIPGIFIYNGFKCITRNCNYSTISQKLEKKHCRENVHEMQACELQYVVLSNGNNRCYLNIQMNPNEVNALPFSS